MNPAYNKSYLKNARQQLRNHGTSAEAFFWFYLKEKKLEGRKFRRQFSIENMIVDFYCTTEKIAIELDGQDHFTPQGLYNDEQRDAKLLQMGIKVLRFENKYVFENTERVVEEIKSNFRIQTP